MTTLFPLWQRDRTEYDAICAYLGLSPNAFLYDRLSEYLANAPFRFRPPYGFPRFLAGLRLNQFRVARLDFATKMLFPEHPFRHAINGVMALHECDADGYSQLAASPTGWTVVSAMFGWGLGFLVRAAITVPWLGWQVGRYTLGMQFRVMNNLVGQRVMITGVNRGLGMDIMLDCLEKGATVVGIVRNREARDSVVSQLPMTPPLTLLVADLATPGALVKALQGAQIEADSIDVAVLCAGVKHDGESVLVLPSLRETFEVNYFSAAEFAAWLCAPRNTAVRSGNSQGMGPASDSNPQSVQGQRETANKKVALVLISSIGRWHGMHGSCGYNASKAALSIWGESLEMELRQSGNRQFAVTIVEPGMFESEMTQKTPLTKLLFVSRRKVAAQIVSGTLAGRKSIRPPFWFALLTWGVCLAGRSVRYRLFARVKPSGKH